MVEKKGFKWVNERPDAKSENDEKWGWIGEKPGAPPWELLVYLYCCCADTGWQGLLFLQRREAGCGAGKKAPAGWLWIVVEARLPLLSCCCPAAGRWFVRPVCQLQVMLHSPVCCCMTESCACDGATTIATHPCPQAISWFWAWTRAAAATPRARGEA